MKIFQVFVVFLALCTATSGVPLAAIQNQDANVPSREHTAKNAYDNLKHFNVNYQKIIRPEIRDNAIHEHQLPTSAVITKMDTDDHDSRMEDRFGIHHGTTTGQFKETTEIPEEIHSLPSTFILPRKKRNDLNIDSHGDQGTRSQAQNDDDCTPEPFWLTVPFYFAITGWGLFAVFLGLYCSLCCKCGKTYREFKNWKSLQDEAIETGNRVIDGPLHARTQSTQTNTMTWFGEIEEVYEGGYKDNKSLNIDRYRPSLYECKYENVWGKMNLKGAERRSIIRGHDTFGRQHSFQDQISYAKSIIVDSDYDRFDSKKVKENRKLIRRMSSGYQGHLNNDVLKYAVSVIIHDENEKKQDQLAAERRKVIREAGLHDRRNSISDAITFAKSVIRPDSHTKYLDKEAQDRRYSIKSIHESIHRHVSFTEDLLIAKAVIAPDQEDADNLLAISDSSPHDERNIHDSWV